MCARLRVPSEIYLPHFHPPKFINCSSMFYIAWHCSTVATTLLVCSLRAVRSQILLFRLSLEDTQIIEVQCSNTYCSLSKEWFFFLACKEKMGVLWWEIFLGSMYDAGLMIVLVNVCLSLELYYLSGSEVILRFLLNQTCFCKHPKSRHV